MKPTDYKRFLNFLRTHECHVPFARFRSIQDRKHPDPADDFSSLRVPDPPNRSGEEGATAADHARR